MVGWSDLRESNPSLLAWKAITRPHRVDRFNEVYHEGDEMMEWLSGKKTYLIAAAMVIVAGLHSQGFISAEVYKIVEGVLMGGGLAALRAGVGKI
jgi:hypothetical protein